MSCSSVLILIKLLLKNTPRRFYNFLQAHKYSVGEVEDKEKYEKPMQN